MSVPAARFPSQSTDLDKLLTPADVARLEAAFDQAARDFQRTTSRSDGTRSAQIVAWAAEFRRVCQSIEDDLLRLPSGWAS